MKRAASRPAPCLACPQRTWRSLHGFMVMGCALKGLRFGTAPDIRRGHVNKAGDCVPMPQACEAPGAAADQRDAGQRRAGEMESGKRQTLPPLSKGDRGDSGDAESPIPLAPPFANREGRTPRHGTCLAHTR